MQFVVTGRDGTDEGALARRMAVRDAHIAATDKLIENGNAIIGAATLNDAGEMNGSVMLVSFPSRTELDAWLAEEPYVTGKVWESVDVVECRVGPSFARLI